MQDKSREKNSNVHLSSKFLAKKQLAFLKAFTKLKANLPLSKMYNYALVFDISSEEENNRYSTPMETLPVNIVGGMDLSDSSVEVWRGSDAELILSSSSASIFESLHAPKKCFAPARNNEGDTFIVEQPPMDAEEDYYEETDSPRQLLPLQP